MNRVTKSNSLAAEGNSDSEIVMMELAVLSQLNKGLYCASKAQAAKDDSEGKLSWIQNANAAYENARHLLAHSPFPISDLAQILNRSIIVRTELVRPCASESPSR